MTRKVDSVAFCAWLNSAAYTDPSFHKARLDLFKLFVETLITPISGTTVELRTHEWLTIKTFLTRKSINEDSVLSFEVTIEDLRIRSNSIQLPSGKQEAESPLQSRKEAETF